ncbi:MAG: TonB-dependent receptor plug domain-containing protein [Flavobacteriaceae bacterium]|nr:TonB-dependent receptor plug domain-containing protein [Bacteroidia bacterium]NNK81721.1 TonB-dependent receptor plug domain-containing protein [Flavobacteriaceae bacterium]
MKPLKISIVLVFILFSLSVMCQTVLRGKVTNNKGEAVSNTLVFLDSVKTNVVSNANGYFRVKVPEGTKKITLFAPKYGFMSLDYAEEKKVSFVFIETLEEKKDTQVLIGYGSEEKKNITTTVNTLNVKDDKNAMIFSDIFDYLRGRVAGVKVTSSNQVYIRGVSSFNLSNEPLFVVDGVIVNSITHILPIEVDKISVLKGASASIYGSRGANGVIEITTKHQ